MCVRVIQCFTNEDHPLAGAPQIASYHSPALLALPCPFPPPCPPQKKIEKEEIIKSSWIKMLSFSQCPQLFITRHPHFFKNHGFGVFGLKIRVVHFVFRSYSFVIICSLPEHA